MSAERTKGRALLFLGLLVCGFALVYFLYIWGDNMFLRIVPMQQWITLCVILGSGILMIKRSQSILVKDYLDTDESEQTEFDESKDNFMDKF